MRPRYPLLNRKSDVCLAFWISLFLGLIHHSVFCVSAAAENPRRFQASGHMEIIVYGEGGNIRTSLLCGFTANIHDCTWLIRTYFPETNIFDLDYCETGTDGISVYFLKSYIPSVTNKVTKHVTRVNGKRVVEERVGAWPKAEGVVYRGIVPKPDESFCTPIWLALASGCVLNSNLTEVLPQLWPFDDPELLDQDFSLEAQWLMLSNNGNFAEQVVFFSDGNYRARSLGKSVLLPAPPPYDKGYTNAIYRVESLTNFAGSMYPRDFVLKRLKPKTSGTSTQDLVLWTEYIGRVDRFEETVIPVGLPDIPSSAAIVDKRFLSQLGQSLVYLSSGKGWLAEEEARNLPNYRMAMVSGFTASKQDKRMSPVTVRAVVLIVLLGVPIVVVTFFHRRNST